MSTVRDYGWIPPDARTPEQKQLTYEFHDLVGYFSDVNTGHKTDREQVLYPQVAKEVLGKILPKVWQVTGSCVGAGAANAYIDAMLGDIVVRGDREDPKPVFPWPTYGKGREIAGMRGPGSGSFGAAQAEACQPHKFGYLPLDFPQAEKPKKIDFWLKWDRETELRWSHPSVWPIKEAELKPKADDFGIHTVTRLRSAEETEAAIEQGYGVTLASMFGTRPFVNDGVLLGRWVTQWAHQMSCGGKWRHPRLGLLFWIQNQWGDAHGVDPTMGKFGVTGGFWTPASDFDKICSTGEVYAHSNTGGFPLRTFDWSDLATYE